MCIRRQVLNFVIDEVDAIELLARITIPFNLNMS
jgi:hypothetical protein